MKAVWLARLQPLVTHVGTVLAAEVCQNQMELSGSLGRLHIGTRSLALIQCHDETWEQIRFPVPTECQRKWMLLRSTNQKALMRPTVDERSMIEPVRKSRG